MSFIHAVDRNLLIHARAPGLCRLGSAHDGGYVVPRRAIESAGHLLSFGVGTNWDFERDALELNPRLTVEAYDPTVGARRFVRTGFRSAISVPLRAATADVRGARTSLQRVKTAIDYFRFFSGRAAHIERRVWYNDDRDSASIETILAAARERGRVPMFAKIDIEGTEYRILPWIIASAELFTGLVVEFHDTDICADAFNRQVADLRTHFQIVHVHGNNYGDLSVDGALPLTLEITFLHRSLVALGPMQAHTERAGLSLDAPNDPARPDYLLDLVVPPPTRESPEARGSGG